MAKIHTIESARELHVLHSWTREGAKGSGEPEMLRPLKNAPTAIRWMSHDVSSLKAAHCVRCDDLVDDLELDERGLCPACVVDVLRCRLTAKGLAASDGFRERLQSSRAKPRGQRRGIQERS